MRSLMVLWLWVISAWATDPELTLVVDPLVQGQPATLNVHGAPPGSTVQVLRGASMGPGRRLPSGDRLQILAGDQGYQRLFTGIADADGVVGWSSSIAEDAARQPVHLQAVVVDGRDTLRSNATTQLLREAFPWHMDDGSNNYSRATATRIDVGSHTGRVCAGQNEYLRVTVPPGRTLQTSTHGTGPWWMPQSVDVNPRTWHNLREEPVDMWLIMSTWSTQTTWCVPYSLTVDVDTPTPCVDDGWEPDNRLADAHPIAIGELVERTVCRGRPDWFRVEAPTAGRMTAVRETPGALVSIEFFDALGGPALSRVEAGDIRYVRARRNADQLDNDVGFRIELTDGCPEQLGTEFDPVPVQLGEEQEMVFCPVSPDAKVWLELPTAPDQRVDIRIHPRTGGTTTIWQGDEAIGGPGFETHNFEERMWRIRSHTYRPWVAEVTFPDGYRFSPVALTVSVTHTPWVRCREDHHEPNDSEAEAVEVSAGTPIVGSSCANNDDVYVFHPTAGVPYDIELEWAEPHPHTLEVNGTPRRYNSPSTELWQTPAPVHLRAPSDGSNGPGYTLRVDERPCADPFEPDNIVQLARALELEQPQTGIACDDRDWFVLTVPPGEERELFADICFQIVDVSGTPISSTCSGSQVLSTPGDWYLLIEPNERRPTYDLLLTKHHTTCQEDAFEPNDVQQDASPLTPGRYDAISCSDEDWYTFEAEVGDRVRTDVDRADGYVNAMSYTVFTPFGDTVEDTSASWVARFTGTYAIRVEGTDRPYRIDLEVEPTDPCAADIHEPNDMQQDAVPLPEDGLFATACPGDEDWYVMDLPAETFIGRVTAMPSDGSVDIEAFNAFGYPFSSWPNGNEHIPGGTSVYVRVVVGSNEDHTAGVDYHFAPLIHFPFCPPEDDRDHRTAATARAISLPFTTSDYACVDPDWYEFETTPGEAIHVNFDSTIRYRRLSVRVLDATGTELHVQRGENGQLSFVATDVLHRVSVETEDHGHAQVYVMSVEEAVCQDDAFEPNNIPLDATPLALGVEHTSMVCGADPDYLRVDLLAGEGVIVSYEADAPHLDLTFEDAAGEALPDDPGDNRFMYIAEQDESIYVHAELSNPSPAHATGALYHVTTSLMPPCEADGFEPNDHWYTATVLSPGTYTDLTACSTATMLDGGDWFRVDVDAGDTLEASTHSPTGDVDLLLYDHVGTLQQWSATTGGDESVSWTARVRGPLFLRVHQWSEGVSEEVGTTYELDVGVVTP